MVEQLLAEQLVAEQLLAPHSSANAANAAGASPIHVATVRGRCEIVQTLLNAGVSPTSADERGATVMHLACSLHCAPAVRPLYPHLELSVVGRCDTGMGGK